jgi:hypothetical protein
MGTTTTDLVKAVTGPAYDPGHIVDDIDLTTRQTPSRSRVSESMTTLVKGVGYAMTDKPTTFGQGGNTALTDPDKIFPRAMRAEKAWNKAITTGIIAPDTVVKSLAPEFASQFGAFMMANPQNMMMSQMVANLQQQVSEALGKSITLTSPLSTGFVPFNLVAP